ncbi:MAG: hypothetical protein HQM08_29620 [Candidatus Riflebacteria bacterium]|nr:hypothetical protein [Candidatus Riflebacteria bacterium]
MKNKKRAWITKPKNLSVFGFDEKIEFAAKAVKTTEDGEIDISDLIEWRKPSKATGNTFSISFKNRESATVAIYLAGVWKASVKLKIVCKACDLKPALSDDEMLLARIIMAEGASCSVEERRTIGYVVVNRYRFFPNHFKATLKDVIYLNGFDGIHNKLFKLLGSKHDIAEKLDYEQCRRYRETLLIAREILGDGESALEQLFVEDGKHAFFMNQAANHPPDGKNSPLIHSNTTSHWEHSFYGYAPNTNQAFLCL